MSTSYSPAAKFPIPGSADRGWDVPLSATIAAIDALACVGGLVVTPAETPSTTLAVRVAPGGFRSASGLPGTYAGNPSYTLPASSLVNLWLSDAGTLGSGTAWPTSGPYVPLGRVTTAAATISAVADARVTAASVGLPAIPPVAVTAAYAVGPSDGLVACNATGGAFTLTLPSAASWPGRAIRAMKVDASGNAVSVASGSLINGAGTLSLATQWQGKTFVSTGSTWLAF